MTTTDTPPAPTLPAGWDATGATDLSQKIGYWLCKHRDIVPIAPPGATYRIDHGVTFQSCIDGDPCWGDPPLDLSHWADAGKPVGFLFTDDPWTDPVHNVAGEDSTRNRTLISLNGLKGARIGGLKLHGPTFGVTDPPKYDKNVEGQAGIQVSNNCDGVVIGQGVIIRGTLGDGIYVGSNQCGPPKQRPTNITIDSVNINGAGRQGISPCNVDGLVIKGANVSNCARHMIDMEPLGGDYRVTDVLIDGTYGANCHLGWIAAGGIGDISNLTVTNNYFEGVMSLFGRTADYGRHDWTITGNWTNWVLGGPFPPFDIANVTNITIAGNHCPAIVDTVFGNPQSRKPWTEKRMANYLLGNGCHNVTVGTKIYNDDGTVKGDSGLPANTWT